MDRENGVVVHPDVPPPEEHQPDELQGDGYERPAIFVGGILHLVDVERAVLVDALGVARWRCAITLYDNNDVSP